MSIERIQIKIQDISNALAGLGLNTHNARRYPNYLTHQTDVGFFDTFRLTRKDGVHQTRDLMVYVFPFVQPDWLAAIDELFAFEARAWKAWWQWSTHAAQDLVATRNAPLTVHPIPPLVQNPDQVIRPFTLELSDGVKLKAFLRPMVEWPALDFQSLTPEQAKALFQGELGFRKVCGQVMGAANAAHAIRGNDGQLGGDTFSFDAEGFATLCNSGDAGRKLLSNGHHVVPTQWRLFHAEYHKYALGQAY